jgi:hypothetical protein
MAFRSDLYRLASLLGDAQAIQKSVQQKSVKPIAKRVVRKAVYRTEGRVTRSALRSLGL